MKKVIVYYPFPILNQKSASYVRPLKMIEAFKKMGEQLNFEVMDIFGEGRERKQQLKKLQDTVNPDDLLFCYMENNTTPFWLTDRDHIPRNLIFDHYFFHYLKSNHIPIGIFYRDIYWKFDSFNNGFSSVILKKVHQMELSVFKKFATKIYLPTESMNQYVQVSKQQLGVLPPGGENFILEKETNKSMLTVIFVGGVSKRYGTDKLLQALDIVNKEKKQIHLILVCREHDFASFKETYSFDYNRTDLEIHHKSGEELKELYRRSDVGIIPTQKNVYNDFAIPVKLFEYLSYRLPIITTNGREKAKIVESNKVGFVVEDSIDGLVEGFKHFLSIDIEKTYKDNIEQALLNKHQWTHRAKAVYDDLLNKD